MKRNQEAIKTRANAAHSAITELTNIALIAAEKADKAETAESKNPEISPEAYSRIENEAIRLAKKAERLSMDLSIMTQKRADMAANCSDARAQAEALIEADEEKDRRIDQLERALCEAQDKLRAEIAEHQSTKSSLAASRTNYTTRERVIASLESENRNLRGIIGRIQSEIRSLAKNE